MPEALRLLAEPHLGWGADWAEEEITAAGLGVAVKVWHGDELPTRKGCGQIPSGYVTRPYFKSFLKGSHNAGHFSYGPYHKFGGLGSFKVYFVMMATKRGSADQKAFMCDIYDFTAKKVLAQTQFKHKDLPGKSDGFVVYTPRSLEIPKPGDHKIEARVFANDTCNIDLLEVRMSWNLL